MASTEASQQIGNHKDAANTTVARLEGSGTEIEWQTTEERARAAEALAEKALRERDIDRRVAQGLAVEVVRLKAALRPAENARDAVLLARSWRVTRLIRQLKNTIPPKLRRYFRQLAKSAYRGFRSAFSAIRQVAAPSSRSFPNTNAVSQKEYTRWIRDYDTLTSQDRAAIRDQIASLPNRPKFSVVMPVFNTSASHLRAAIDSVRAQLYPCWELCIADDASSAPHVAELVRGAAAAERRVKWVRREANGGIAAATNSALTLATGEFVAFLDHDDLLSEKALYEMAVALRDYPDTDLLYSDEDKLDEHGLRYHPFFKGDWNYELLLGQNYINHLTVVRRSIVTELGGLREGFEGSQDYDLVLRVVSRVGGPVRHVPAILYHWRHDEETDAFSVRNMERCIDSARRALADHFAMRSDGGVEILPAPGAPMWSRVRLPIPRPSPLVTVIIPTRDHVDLLETCIDGVLHRTAYANLEILVVDNDSRGAKTRAFLNRISGAQRVRVLDAPGPFNYSALNNDAVAQARGTIIALLNNDIDVIGPGWLDEMVSWAVKPEIGAVGAKLLYGHGDVQHAGVVLGIGEFDGGPGVAGHFGLHALRHDPGYFGQFALTREVSAVTAACLVIRKEIYRAAGGLDAVNLPVSFNDVDFCLRLRDRGLVNIWTPAAELFHLESASRGSDLLSEKRARFHREAGYMRQRWGNVLDTDPFYNPHFCRRDPNFHMLRPDLTLKSWQRDG